jgi:hypothetical protein
MKSGSLNLLEPSGPVKACNGIALYIYMDLRLATLKAVSFYLLHNVSTLNQDWTGNRRSMQALDVIFASVFHPAVHT